MPAGPGAARAARALSRATTPYLTVPAFILVSGMRYVDAPLEGLLYGAVLVLATVALPLAHVLVLKRRGLVDSIHVGDRRARLGPIATATVGAVLGLAVVWLLGAPDGVLRLGAVLAALAAAVLGATSALKVSGHVTAWSAGTTVLSLLYGWGAVPLIAVAAPIAWARHVLGRHTPLELAGALLCGGGAAAALMLVAGLP